MHEDITLIDYGTCCQCEGELGDVNVLSMDFRAPVIGTGWGCAICGLPFDGALVILCDTCIHNFDIQNTLVVDGVIAGQGRIHISTIDTETRFQHNISKHQALDRSNGHVK